MLFYSITRITAAAVCTCIVYSVLQYSDRMLFRVRSCKVKKEKMINHLKNIIPKRVRVHLFSLKPYTGYKKTNKPKKPRVFLSSCNIFSPTQAKPFKRNVNWLMCVHTGEYILPGHTQDTLSGMESSFYFILHAWPLTSRVWFGYTNLDWKYLCIYFCLYISNIKQSAVFDVCPTPA